MPDSSVKRLEIPPRGSRGTGGPPGWLIKVFARVMNMQVSRLRRSTAPELPRMMGFPVLLLTTVGAKTGTERTHVVRGFPESDSSWIVAASKGGAPTHPHWFVNLASNPDSVWVEIGNRRFKVRPALLKGGEREAALARVAAVAPRYGDHQKKTDREIPVILLERTAA